MDTVFHLLTYIMRKLLDASCNCLLWQSDFIYFFSILLSPTRCKNFLETGLNNFFTERQRLVLFSRRESNFVGYFKQAMGRSPPLKTEKVSLFAMILYNLEKNIRDIRPFCRTVWFFTAVLWSMLHLSDSSEAVNEPCLPIITEIALLLT